MEYQHIRLERAGPIATVTFNRPSKANAVHYDHLAEIEHAALSFRDDAETRVVIFTGEGKHFCSGADLTDSGEAYQVPMVLRRRRMRIGERTIAALREMDQITIAAWNGGAMGGGACIALALDLRLGCPDSFIQFPEIDIGVNLMWQSLPLAVQMVGPARAKRLVVGGERVYGPALMDWGVVDHLSAAEELQTAALTMARIYAAKAPIAAQMIKRSINQLASAHDRAIMHMDADQNMLTQTTADRRAAIEAYLAGKDPKFSGD